MKEVSDMSRFSAGRGVGDGVEGEAVACRQPIHFGQDFTENGVGKNPRHELYGKSIKDKILVLTEPKSGSGVSGMPLLEMAENRSAPRGLVYSVASPIMVLGAILANIPIMDQFDRSPIDAIQNGDWVIMDPKAHVLEVRKRG